MMDHSRFDYGILDMSNFFNGFRNGELFIPKILMSLMVFNMYRYLSWDKLWFCSMQLEVFNLLMNRRVPLNNIKVFLQGSALLHGWNILEMNFFILRVVMSIVIAGVRLNHFLHQLVRLYDSLNKLNVFLLDDSRGLVPTKRVLRVNMHMVDSMNAGVANPMMYGVLG